MPSERVQHEVLTRIRIHLPSGRYGHQPIPVDNFGTAVGENPDCLLLSGTGVSENLDHVSWGTFILCG